MKQNRLRLRRSVSKETDAHEWEKTTQGRDRKRPRRCDPSFALFDSLRFVIPTFATDVAACLSLKEQVTVFCLVCKDFRSAIPRFWPVVYEKVHPVVKMIVDDATNVMDPYHCVEGDELVYQYNDGSFRSENHHGHNWSFRLRCVETTDDECFFSVRARLRPDSERLVGSFDFLSNEIRIRIPWSSNGQRRAGQERFRTFHGSVIGRAHELHKAHSLRETSPMLWTSEDASLSEDALQQWRERPFAVVDLGKWGASSLLGEKNSPDRPEWFCDMRFMGNDNIVAHLMQLEHQEIREGAVYVDAALKESRRQSLVRAIQRFKDTQDEPDYRPMSGDKVRELVHPALYCYVEGESPFVGSLDLASPEDAPQYVYINQESFGEDSNVSHETRANYAGVQDMWGRAYWGIKRQWLPTYFGVSPAGKVTIEGFINGIDRKAHPELYGELARLFESALPLLEHSWTYGSRLEASAVHTDSDDEGPCGTPMLKLLRGVRLQVITKIADYELQPGQEYESDWNMDGMPCENIVATAVYVAERDEAIDGGVLHFRRIFKPCEDVDLAYVDQEKLVHVMDWKGKQLSLGTLETPQNRLLVFSNSHLHMLGKLTNTGTTAAIRRIVVFFLVNPRVRTVSTQEVPDQRGRMSLERAKEHRLELMKERRLDNRERNVRMQLCEH